MQTCSISGVCACVSLGAAPNENGDPYGDRLRLRTPVQRLLTSLTRQHATVNQLERTDWSWLRVCGDLADRLGVSVVRAAVALVF